MSYMILSNLIVERADVYKTPTGTRRYFMPGTHLVESIVALRAKKFLQHILRITLVCIDIEEHKHESVVFKKASKLFKSLLIVVPKKEFKKINKRGSVQVGTPLKARKEQSTSKHQGFSFEIILHFTVPTLPNGNLFGGAHCSRSSASLVFRNLLRIQRQNFDTAQTLPNSTCSSLVECNSLWI